MSECSTSNVPSTVRLHRDPSTVFYRRALANGIVEFSGLSRKHAANLDETDVFRNRPTHDTLSRGCECELLEAAASRIMESLVRFSGRTLGVSKKIKMPVYDVPNFPSSWGDKIVKGKIK